MSIQRKEHTPPAQTYVAEWIVQSSALRQVRATVVAETATEYVRVRVPDNEFNPEQLDELIQCLTEARDQEEIPT